MSETDNRDTLDITVIGKSSTSAIALVVHENSWVDDTFNISATDHGEETAAKHKAYLINIYSYERLETGKFELHDTGAIKVEFGYHGHPPVPVTSGTFQVDSIDYDSHYLSGSFVFKVSLNEDEGPQTLDCWEFTLGPEKAD